MQIFNERERALYRLQAALCQTMADPARLEILQILGDGPRPVKDLVTATGERQAKISQHMAVLRQRGIVASTRVGVEMHYSLTDTRILDACRITRDMLLDQLKRQSHLAAELGAIAPAETLEPNQAHSPE